jgi:hypothetical protein
MTSEKSVIRDSLRQVQKIYEQISTLIKTADGLMGEHGWETERSAVIAYSSAAVYAPKQWLPLVLTRKYLNKDFRNTMLAMGVLLDDEGVDEPIIIGTQMSLRDTSEEFPYTTDYDDPYFWYLKSVNFDTFGDVVVIEDPQELHEKETRNLGRILTFATPLLEIESSDQLRNKFVSKLLALQK